MTLKSFLFATATGAALVTLSAIGSWAQHADVPAMGGVTKAVAVLHATKKGGDVHGKVTFTQTPKGILVEGTVEGLTPGLHGFHVHEFGDCSSDDAMSAGGHFNPTGAKHSGPHSDKRHVGDLGNIEANDKGVAKIDLIDTAITLSGATSIVGRGLIVHAKADDLKSDPAGAAGDRIACGVVGVAKAAGMMSGTAPAKKK